MANAANGVAFDLEPQDFGGWRKLLRSDVWFPWDDIEHCISEDSFFFF